MTVLAFVEASEYRKELARQLARNLVSQIGVETLLEGGEQAAADLVTVLGEELAGLTRQALSDALSHAAADGLVEIDEASALQTMRAAIERVLTSARAQLAARLAELDATVARILSASGADALAASLATPATTEALLSPILSILTGAASGAIQAVESDMRTEAVAATREQGQAAPGTEPLLFEWQTREDDKVCQDLIENSCEPRHGQQLTYEEWGVFGYPGDPDSPTICAIYAKNPGASNCRCVLIPAGSAAATPEPVNISEAAKAGRERALKEAA